MRVLVTASHRDMTDIYFVFILIISLFFWPVSLLFVFVVVALNQLPRDGSGGMYMRYGYGQLRAAGSPRQLNLKQNQNQNQNQNQKQSPSQKLTVSATATATSALSQGDVMATPKVAFIRFNRSSINYNQSQKADGKQFCGSWICLCRTWGWGTSSAGWPKLKVNKKLEIITLKSTPR